MKIVLSLAILLTPALWADEATERTAVEATISALNTSPDPLNIFTADFPNAAELQNFRARLPVLSRGIGTLVISREPMGEATWYPNLSNTTATRFVTRSVTFVAPDTAVVVAMYGRESVLFVVRNESSNWRIASFRVLPEAGPR